ncbi:MAG: 50S ribosomal protein L19 [Candidatus Omnitrophica bacterium]|nr:50S ribosomal protein L19 [Candidatus Omnitrophota bacterium]
MDWLTQVHGTAPPERPAFRPGDEVRVWYRILEQGKERLGQFEGIVIRLRGAGRSRTFTVRRVTHGEGVERVFPVDSKIISKIDVLRQGKVRRSRLYFLRSVIGKRRIAAASEPKTLNAEPATEKPEGIAAATGQPAPQP